MIRSALFVLALARGALAQQAGTLSPTESHPKLAIQQCSSAGCETLARSIVLDANWRWFDEAGANCFDGYAWAPVCDGDPTCTRVCALEGGNYEGTYGIKAAGHNLTIGFVTRGGSGNNVGSRSYLMAEDDENYEMFKLLNKEFTFTVDMSKMPCGLNGAVYFVEMDADGGKSKFSTNEAGAKLGTGYCDAQCPHDLKWINGEPNLIDWAPSKDDPNAGTGKYGTCCVEMDRALAEPPSELACGAVNACE